MGLTPFRFRIRTMKLLIVLALIAAADVLARHATIAGGPRAAAALRIGTQADPIDRRLCLSVRPMARLMSPH